MLSGRHWLLAGLLTAVIVAALYYATRQRSPLIAPVAKPATGGLPVALPADKCATCHQRESATIVHQWSRSTHARRGVTCYECHEVDEQYPTAREHFGTYVSATVTPKTCGRCHPEEAREYAHSRHALPAWTAMAGYDDLSPEFKAQFDEIAEVRRAPQGGELPTGFVGATRNALYDLEGDALVQAGCRSCHQIGRPNLDGTAGNCNACHLRHEFSREQARRPETCSRCHIGPDHPQWEIYQESSHGILYHIQGHTWNWEQRTGRLGVADIPAATCQICHMSGFGNQPTTHDVGDRLSLFLFAEISDHRPQWQENRQRMRSICAQCHTPPFIEEQYALGDAVTEAINERVRAAKTLMEGLVADGLLTSKPFDHPLKFVAFNLWHHWGRTAKFGAWMQGPDYTQWHGIYPLMEEMAELEEGARELREQAHSAQPEATN